MVGPQNPKDMPKELPKSRSSGTTRRTAVGLILGAPLLGACSGVQQSLSQFSNPFSSQPGSSGPPQQPLVAGTGQVKVGLILPLSGSGNAGVAAQSMKNAAEMALAEFQNPNIQLLIKDDAGNAPSRERSRRSTKALRSFWARCLRRRCRRPRS
jgi:ABC-type branched-subunit amino acid transport system substrate-binding protein